MRKTHELSLRKLTDGANTELGTVPFPVTLGQPYLLRVDAIGDRLRVYVDDVLFIERPVSDIVVGKVGVMTYRTAATFSQYTAYEP